MILQITNLPSKLIQEEDDDAIVDNNEIDTNNNLDGDWALTIPRTYRSSELRKWRLAPVVPNTYGLPGEMGNGFNVFFFIDYNNKKKIHTFRQASQDSSRETKSYERKV